MDFDLHREEPIAQNENFETRRLSIRRTTANDKDALTPVLKNPDLMKGWRLTEPPDPQEFINQAIAGWEFQRTYEARFTFTLIDKASDRVVGCAIIQLKPPNADKGRGLWAEPSMVIARDLYGKGYGPEAMRGLIGWSFDDIKYPDDVTISEIWATCLPCNSGSIHLLRKLTPIGMEDLGDQEISLVNPGPDEEPTITAHAFRLIRANYNP